MNIFIMTDLEGVAGVLDSENWCSQNGLYYSRAREFLTMEINAAVEGFLEAGASEIIVADGHGGGAVNPDELHDGARLIRNWGRGQQGGFSMDAFDFDCAAWVGQHPMAGTCGGHLSHTGNFGVVEQTVNGIEIGEFGDLVLVASSLKVRAVFASGCEAFCAEARNFVPGIETAAVKKGLSSGTGDHLPREAYRKFNESAAHLNPREARKRIREGARKAVERAGREDFGIVELPPPPYKRIRVLRADSEYPPRILAQEHPDSIIEMHRMPYEMYELIINPSAPGLKNMLGGRINF